MVNVGDFILHLRSFEGGLEVAKQQGIISPAYHTFHGKESDSRFYYPFFRSFQFINILLKPHVFGIRDGKSIDVEGMKKIKIPYPSYAEQKQFGDFFDQLDQAITLHQRAPNDAQSRLPIQTGGAIFTKQGYCLLSSGFNSLRISSLNSLLI